MISNKVSVETTKLSIAVASRKYSNNAGSIRGADTKFYKCHILALKISRRFQVNRHD
jgi:hypothetical protein